MNFIKAVITISKRKDLELCASLAELKGKYDICVYWKDSDFIGKLRWPIKDDDRKLISPAHIDHEVEVVLKEKLTQKQFNKRFIPVTLPMPGEVSYKGFKKL